MTFKLTKSLKRRADERIKRYNEITSREPTDKNIEVFSQLIDLPIHMSKRYFKKTCKECNGVVNYEDIAMLHRYCGRYDNLKDDNRQYLCKDHLAELLGLSGKEYWLKIYENMQNNCNLF